MRRMRNWLLWLAPFWLWAGLAGAAAPPEPLRLGLFPNQSARALVALYQPLQAHLETALGRPVELFTAPDFKTFVERTHARQYDLVVTAPHLARLAQTEARWQPLFSYSQRLHAVIITLQGGAVRSLEDLRGQTVALPDRLAVIPILGLRLLQEQGLRREADFKLLQAGSHSNAALAVQRGEAQAAIIGSIPFFQLSREAHARLHVLAATASIPSQFLLLNPDREASLADVVRQALLDFAASPRGRDFFERSGFGGVQAASEAELQSMEPYAREVARLLREAP